VDAQDHPEVERAVDRQPDVAIRPVHRVARGGLAHAEQPIALLCTPVTLPGSDNHFRGTPVPKEYVRLTTPLVRDGDRRSGAPLRPATWDEALQRTADGLRKAGEAHGPRTYGIFSCSRSTNEVNYAAGKLARVVLGTNNIDSCNRT
jgi:hypothetical protein